MTLTMDQLNARLEEFLSEISGRFAAGSVQQDVDRLNGWRKKLQLDDSFGRMLNGPQWISGTAVRDGAITADKLEANLVIANLFTTSSTGTGARMELDATSLRFYRASGTLVSELKSDGSGFLGSTGGSAATAALAWSTTPAVTIAGTLTLASGGKIVDADGSYWDQNGIVLAASGSAGDTISWNVSGVAKGYITADSSSFFLNRAAGGAGVQLGATTLQLGVQGPSYSTLGPLLLVDHTAEKVQVTTTGGTHDLIDANGDMKVYRRLSAGNQATGYLDWDSGNARHRFNGGPLATTYGIYPGAGGSAQTTAQILWSGTAIQISGARLDVTGQGLELPLTTGISGGALPNPTKAVSFVNGGTTYYIPAFTNTGPWTA